MENIKIQFKSRQEIKEILKNIPSTANGAIAISKKPGTKFYELRENILHYTKFIDGKKVNFSVRIYAILNDIYEWPKCQCGCGKELNHINRKFLPNHGNRSKEVQEKKKQTWIKTLGTDNPSKSEKIKQKKVKTLQKHYGENVTSCNKIKTKNAYHRILKMCEYKLKEFLVTEEEFIKNGTKYIHYKWKCLICGRILEGSPIPKCKWCEPNIYYNKKFKLK